MITLRLATMSDAARLFAWRMESEAQSNSFTAGPESFATHVAWLAATLRKADIDILVAHDMERSVAAGYCRLDHRDDNEVDISIAVDKAQRGRGYAAQIIQLVLESRFPEGTRFRALVKETNTASLRLFWALQFTTILPSTEGWLVLERQP